MPEMEIVKERRGGRKKCLEEKSDHMSDRHTHVEKNDSFSLFLAWSERDESVKIVVPSDPSGAAWTSTSGCLGVSMAPLTDFILGRFSRLGFFSFGSSFSSAVIAAGEASTVAV